MSIKVVGMGYDTAPDYLAYKNGVDEDERTSFRAGVRSYMNSTLTNAYVQIHTDEDADVISQIRISVSWAGIKKNVAGTYGTYSDTTWSEFDSPSTECNPHTSTKYSGTDWSVELRQIGTYAAGGVSTTTLGNTIANGSNYNFSSRTYDSVRMLFTVVVAYNNGQSESRVTCNEFYLTYFPVYTLSSLVIEDDALVVSYTCGDYARTDDRWEVESLTQGGSELVVSTSSAYVTFGSIDAVGRLTIPLTAFKKIPSSMTSTYVDVRMNAYFREEGAEWGHVEGTTTLTNTGDCNTPTLALVSKSEDALVVRVGDANDKSNPLETVYVTMEDYSGTGTTASTSPGANVTFVYPPLNRSITVDAIGYDADGDASDVVTLSVGTITSSTTSSGSSSSGGSSESETVVDATPVTVPTIAAQDGSASVKLRFNVTMDWTYEPVYETVKFAGRSRETVGYGTGGSATGTLGCDILDDTSYGDYYQSKDDFEALAFAGLCIYRDDTGARKSVMVESVGESWDTVRRCKTMSISVREVS